MADIIIRKATAEDATGIAIVRAYTWATAYHGLMPDSVLESRISGVKANAGRMKSLIETGAFDYAVAIHNNAVIGFVSRGKSRDARYEKRGEIGALYVLKGFSGLGTGRELFNFAKNRLANRGYKSMIINCLQGNPSLEFYKHMGGTVVARRTDEIFDGVKITEDVLKFEL